MLVFYIKIHTNLMTRYDVCLSCIRSTQRLNNMSLKTQSFVSSSLKASYLAVTLALAYPVATNAAVLGDIHVMSSFGQPFKAEIPLDKVSSREDGKLVAGLGKPEDYQKQKADFNAEYASLQFNVVKRGEQQFVEISSAAPLHVALYDLVVELRGGLQRQVKSYSFMMDSTAANAGEEDSSKTEITSPVISPATLSSPVSEPVNTENNSDHQLAQQVVKSGANGDAQPISSTPQPVPADQKAPAPAVKANSKSTALRPPLPKGGENKSFIVSRGDILGSIAQQTKPRSVSLNQMMVALLRANPDAFVDNNINRLRSGVILKVPTTAQASSINAKEADQVVIAQIQDFDRYRQSLANHIANSKGDRAKNVQRGKGQIALHVAEEKNHGRAQDRLTLSKSGKSSGKTEDHIASRKALEDADNRVKALEKNVEDLQKLLALKNQALAEAQAQSAEQADKKANPQLDKKGFFAELGEGFKNAWKRLVNFFGSLNDIPHFMQIAVGLLIGLVALLLGLILNRVRKNKKTEPEQTNDNSRFAAIAGSGAAVAGTVAAASLASSSDEEPELDESELADNANTQPVDIANKIDFDLDLDNAQATAEEPVVDDVVAASDSVAPEVAPAAEPQDTVQPEVDVPVVQAPAASEAEVPPVTPAAPAAAESTAVDEDKLELDIPDGVDENGMPTPEQTQRDELTMKLDLASAYQEIGDTEGAKELLEEIVNSNNAEFAAQAREKLAALQQA